MNNLWIHIRTMLHLEVMKKPLFTLVIILTLSLPLSVQAISNSDLIAQIQSLLKMVQQLQAQLVALNGTSPTPATLGNISTSKTLPTFCSSLPTTRFGIGLRSPNVIKLQQFLKTTGDFSYPEFTQYYGSVTQRAVQDYQCREMSICGGAVWDTGYGLAGPATRKNMCTTQLNTLPVLNSRPQQGTSAPLTSLTDSGGVSTPTTSTATPSSISQISTAPSLVTAATALPSCTSNNTTIQSGQAEIRTHYQSATVPYGQQCQSESQSRICTNGSWGEWDGEYIHDMCTTEIVNNMIQDWGFNTGIIVNRPYPVAHFEEDRWHPFGNINKGNQYPKWRLTQWRSKYSIANITPTKDNGNVVSYANGAKEITFSDDGSVRLRLNTGVEYGDENGVKFGEVWPSLFIEQELLPKKDFSKYGFKQNVAHNDIWYLSSLQEVRFYGHHRLINRGAISTTSNDAHRTVQDLITLIIQNRNINSNSYGDYFYLNFLLHDSRYGCVPEYAANDTANTEARFIYSPSSCDFLNKVYDTTVVNNQSWQTIDIDILPFIKRGLMLAHSVGKVKGTTLDDLAITNISMGFEAPGAIDIESEYKQIQISLLKKDASSFIRDETRKRQIETIKEALQNYFDEFGYYPKVGADGNAYDVFELEDILVSEYISKIPRDLFGEQWAGITYVRGGQDSYALRVRFEEMGVCKTGVNVYSGWWGKFIPECGF